jgi:drug/metabolite transporter (DMT)-like permease
MVGVLAFGEELPLWKLITTILIVAGVSFFTLSGRILQYLSHRNASVGGRQGIRPAGRTGQ